MVVLKQQQTDQRGAPGSKASVLWPLIRLLSAMHVVRSLLYEEGNTGMAAQNAKVAMDGEQITGSFLGDFSGCSQTTQVRGWNGMG